MKAKNIFKTLAFAMLMPALLLIYACSDINENEDTNKKGFTLPVTVSVTRQGDETTTKATYTDNGDNTGTLSFSSGDKLFIKGSESTMNAGQFAGTLTYDALSGKFSGTIITENKWTGAAADLFSAAAFESSGELSATLLPAGYDEIGFLSISGSGCSASLVAPDYSKAVATDKATAVEQFSLEQAGKTEYSYDSSTRSGSFALSPQNAIVSFTLTGLAANASFIPTFYDENSHTIGGKKIDANASGTAVFAMGVDGSLGAQNWRLHDGMSSFVFSVITIGSHSLAAGYIYNIARSPLSNAFVNNTVSRFAFTGYLGTVPIGDLTLEATYTNGSFDTVNKGGSLASVVTASMARDVNNLVITVTVDFSAYGKGTKTGTMTIDTANSTYTWSNGTAGNYINLTGITIDGNDITPLPTPAS